MVTDTEMGNVPLIEQQKTDMRPKVMEDQGQEWQHPHHSTDKYPAASKVTWRRRRKESKRAAAVVHAAPSETDQNGRQPIRAGSGGRTGCVSVNVCSPLQAPAVVSGKLGSQSAASQSLLGPVLTAGLEISGSLSERPYR